MAEQISVSDVYQSKILSYVLSRSYAKHIPRATYDHRRAAMYFKRFLIALTGQN